MKVDSKFFSEVVEKISGQMKVIDEERGKIDDLILELYHLKDNCDSAYDDLWRAWDAMSELV